MALNRPAAKRGGIRAKRRRGTSWFWMGGGLVVLMVILAAVSWFFHGFSEPPQEDSQAKRRLIPDSGRARMIQIVEQKTGRKLVAPQLVPPKAEENNLGWYTNKMGEIKRRTGKKVVFRDAPARSLFTHPAEIQLSGIVNTPLGSNYYDEDVPEDFEDQFAFSLTNRIEIADDDPPDVVEKKMRVIEAKETLLELKRNGADLIQVLRDEKELLKKKFEDYIFFDEGLSQLRAEDATPEEIAEYALAAKQMMQEREIEEPLILDTDEADAMAIIDNLINGNDAGQEEAYE